MPLDVLLTRLDGPARLALVDKGSRVALTTALLESRSDPTRYRSSAAAPTLAVLLDEDVLTRPPSSSSSVTLLVVTMGSVSPTAQLPVR